MMRNQLRTVFQIEVVVEEVMKWALQEKMYFTSDDSIIPSV